MSSDHTLGPFEKVCRLLLSNFFEETNIVKVGEYLLRKGTCSFFNIKTGTGMSVWDVKRSLAVLIQHSLVTFKASEQNPNSAEYKLCKHNVYCLLRYPKYLNVIKKIYGSSEKVLMVILLSLGQASASKIIFQSANKLNEAIDDVKVINPSDLYQSFQKLATDNFIIRCAKIEENAKIEKVPKLLELDEKEKFVVPPLEMEPIAKLLREKATELGEHSDSEIIWRVNHQRFDVELRNVILVNAAARRVDETAVHLYHLILKLWRDSSPPEAVEALVTNGVPHILIKEAVRRNDGSSSMLFEHFDQYLRVLYEDSTGFISRVGDSGGGLFVLNYADVFENLACAILDSIVLEKFGPNALRIFRLTRMQDPKPPVDQDQMQKLAVIPAEDAKMFSNKLMEESFLQIKEEKKGTSNVGPVKYFNLFFVNLPQVVREVLKTSYKCISNAMERQQHDLTANQRLLDRHASIENSLERLRGEDAPDDVLAEISETMTAADKELVAKIHKLSSKLTSARIEADETILILESYLKFHSMRSK